MSIKERFQDWFEEFLVGKKEIPTTADAALVPVHSTRRFIDEHDVVWEIGITYTGRLVVRRGRLNQEAPSIEWEEWVTQHQVLIESE